MPGYGDSPPAEMVATVQGRVAFLDRVFQELGMQKPVLVSPSMSGRFALPFLLARGDQLAGIVPVAPVGTKDYAAEQYQQVQVRWVGVPGCWRPSWASWLEGGMKDGSVLGLVRGHLCPPPALGGAGTCLP